MTDCPDPYLTDASAVQASRSSQSKVGPDMQALALQASLTVHELPSSQATLFATKPQPLAELQASSVHGLTSSQTSGGPGAHDPAEQMSPLVHA